MMKALRRADRLVVDLGLLDWDWERALRPLAYAGTQ
jgi:hypothetical protein